MHAPSVPADEDFRTGSPVRLTSAGWVLGALVTALVLWSPHVLFGYRNPSLHLVLDSVDACVALLTAYLLYGRFVRRGRWQDLLLAQGLVLLALAGLGLSYAAEWLDGGRNGMLDVWLPLTLRVVGALLVAGAALVGPSREARSAARSWAVALPMAVVAVATLVLWIIRSGLPVALGPPGDPAATEPAVLTGHPVLVAVQVLTALCFLVASVAFTVQAAGRRDALLRWLGPACALATFARINYALFPSLYTDWLYTGDVLRTGFYLLLLIGAAREIEQYWSAQSRAAVLEDRRRLARELHDGVIQELSLIRMEAHAISPREPARAQILTACDRALDEARAAVQALGHGGDEPLGFVLHRAAYEMAERYRIELEVDVDDAIDVGPDQRHALVRIAREAVTNAVRHGRAQRLCLQLVRDGERRQLVVKDDGEGFDVSQAEGPEAGYGLISMRDRANALPGSLELRSVPGSGSEVTVTW